MAVPGSQVPVPPDATTPGFPVPGVPFPAGQHPWLDWLRGMLGGERPPRRGWARHFGLIPAGEFQRPQAPSSPQQALEMIQKWMTQSRGGPAEPSGWYMTGTPFPSAGPNTGGYTWTPEELKGKRWNFPVEPGV